MLASLRDRNSIIGEIKEVRLSLQARHSRGGWTVGDEKEIALIQRRYSKLMREYAEYVFLSNPLKSVPLRFSIFFDFRGRMYYNSEFGPTQSKVLRLAFNYGYYTKEDFENRKPSIELMPYYSLIRQVCDENGYEYRDYFYDVYF
jgi:hypothetical protein